MISYACLMKAEHETPNRIKELREAKGWTQERLGTEAKTTQQTIDRLEKGQRQLTVKWLKTLSDALGCGQMEILSAQPMHEKAANIHNLKPRNQGIHSSSERLTTPVFGPAAAGSPERILLTDEFVVEEIETPNELIGVRGGFAMYVAGDSMYPRYRHGELVAVHPNKHPNITQDCVVILAEEGNAVVKEFAGETDSKEEWKFKQHNPPKTIKYKKSEVRAIYAIVGRPS